ncbi:MAG: hypothetical protein ACLQFR_00945 [Streptosporangiaceae bacterium]
MASERHGSWRKAATPPGVPARYNAAYSGFAAVSAVACPPKFALCVAGGSKTPAKSIGAQAFIVSQVG